MNGVFAERVLLSVSSNIFKRTSRTIATNKIIYKEAPPSKGFDEDLLADIHRKIEQNKGILRRHSFSHIRAREVSHSISNLNSSMNSVKAKVFAAMDSSPNSVCNIPAYVSIEVLGNGRCHMRPCVTIRTPFKTYLINCPEGTSRFLPQLRVKAMNVNDIFITRSTWDNIAGISSILLSKENGALLTRMHGSMNVKNFLECIRPFQDSDYGSTKYPSQVEERAYTMESYEDAGMKVTYIPLSPPFGTNPDKRKKCVVDVSYLFELKAAARRIDASKLIALQVPKGPLIGKLKNGESVILPNGNTVNPSDVYSEHIPPDEKGSVLFLECSSLDHLAALVENSIFKTIVAGKRKLNYMFHLCDAKLLYSPEYMKMISSLPNTQHIALNQNSPYVPGIESVFRNHHLLNTICPSVFPSLYPQEWKGLISQGDELAQTHSNQITLAAPIQRFWMRRGGNEEPALIDLRNNLNLTDEALKLINELSEEEKSISSRCEFPRVSFLGTSSAVPSKYRNVSGYLLESCEDTAVLIDVGEGTHGTLQVERGDEGCKKLLRKLRGVFITHAHQDHMNGLFTIIERRKEAFAEAGLDYVPLILITNRNVLKPLRTYSMCFDDLESLISVVDISRFPDTPPVSPGGPPGKKRRLPSPNAAASRDIVDMMPRPWFDEKIWNITEIKAVQVHHTRMANGFVFGVGGKRVVFSGDTKPCDLLVEEGMGADLLIHEATFEDGHEADAMRKKHSTMGQAIDVGKRMKASHIILTHFSARYPKVPALPNYLEELGNVSVAMDNMSVPFDHLSLLPKLIPIYRNVYAEELFEIEMKKEQKKFRETRKEEHESKAKDPVSTKV